MDTPQVTLDERTAKELAKAGRQPVALCDPAGAMIGYYVSPQQMSRIEAERKALYNEIDQLFPKEEMERIRERRKHDPRPNIPHEEVIRWIEGQ